MDKPKPRRKVKRVVLGVGHPWFTYRTRDGGYSMVELLKRDGSGGSVAMNIGKLGGYNKIRLVAEIL